MQHNGLSAKDGCSPNSTINKSLSTEDRIFCNKMDSFWKISISLFPQRIEQYSVVVNKF